MNRIRALFIKHHDIIIYLIFGGLTTLVNFLVYFPLYNWVEMSGTLSNVIAWSIAVISAFFTNKPLVFKSYDWAPKTVIPEFAKVISCRIGSGLMETAAIWLFVDLLMWNGNGVKIIVSVLVVILNYIFSKWLVFKDSNA